MTSRNSFPTALLAWGLSYGLFCALVYMFWPAFDRAPVESDERRAVTASDGYLPVVVGRVVAADGEPLVGVAIEYRRGGAYLMPWIASDAVSGDDGTFSLTILGLKKAELRFVLPGHVRRVLEDVEPLFAESIDVGETVLEESAVLFGRVLGQAGAGVPDCEIRLLDANRWSNRRRTVMGLEVEARTDGEGRFRVDHVPIGPWTVRVDSQHGPPALRTGEATAVGIAGEELLVKLGAGASMGGSVTRIPPDLDDEICVFIESNDDEAVYECRRADLDHEGAFEFKGLSPGAEYGLMLEQKPPEGMGIHVSYGPQLSYRVLARAGDSGIEIEFLGESIIEFEVVDALTGAGVESPRVEFDRNPRGGLANRPRVITGAGGEVRVEGFRRKWKDEPVGIRVTGLGYAPHELVLPEFEPGDQVDLDRIALTEVGIVAVRVRNADGDPIPDASITLRAGPSLGDRRGHKVETRSTSNESRFTYEYGYQVGSASTNAGGVARMTLPEGGPFEVSVVADGYADARLANLSLQAGSEIDFDLNMGGAVVIEARDADGNPLPGRRIQRQYRGGRREKQGVRLRPDESVHADEVGKYTFTSLASGRHVFRLAPTSRGTGRPLHGLGPKSNESFPWTEVEVVDGESKVLLLFPDSVDGRR